MRPIRSIGYILFIFGIILASIFSAPEKPIWSIFTIFISIAFIGALLARIKSNLESFPNIDVDTDTSKMIESSLYTHLREIQDKISDLRKLASNNQFECLNIKKAIEEIQHLVKYFIDERIYVQKKHGIKNTTEIYSSFSRGERSLSRAWSALVDGDLDEMKVSLEQSESRFYYTIVQFYNLIKSV